MTADVAGKYQLLAELGSGGMARVYLAHSSGPAGFGKLVVLKILRQEIASDPDMVEMFLHEARLAGRLNHPNVVQTLEAGEYDDQFMLVMEYLDGQTLAAVHRRLAKRGRLLPMAIHLHVLSEALTGLHYAHELQDFDGQPLNIVHRDVSPQNIFLTYDGQVKVLDFGIAKAASSGETRTGLLKGKLKYMAPEQFRGDTLDRRLDVYAMGTLLWHAAAGHHLWKGETDAAVMYRVTRGEVPLPSQFNPECMPQLAAIAMKALSISVEHRHPTAAALQDELSVVMQRVGTVPTTKELGSFVADLFADHRQRIRRIVEDQMSGDRKSVPAIHPTTQTIPSIPAAVEETRDSRDGSTSHGRGYAASIGSSRARHRRRTWMVVAATSAVSVGLGAVGARALLYEGDAPPQIVSSTSASQAEHVVTQQSERQSSVVGDVLPPLVELTVSATPETALLFVDNEPVEGNPYTFQLTPSDKTIRVRAEARGFVSRTLEVTADRSQSVMIALSPQSRSPQSRSPQSRRGGDPKLDPESPVASGAKPNPEPKPASPPTTPTESAQSEPRLGTDNIDPWDM